MFCSLNSLMALDRKQNRVGYFQLNLFVTIALARPSSSLVISYSICVVDNEPLESSQQLKMAITLMTCLMVLQCAQIKKKASCSPQFQPPPTPIQVSKAIVSLLSTSSFHPFLSASTCA